MSWLWGSNNKSSSGSAETSIEEYTKIPSFFPYAPKECKDKSTVIFNCLNSKSEKENDHDVDAGTRGIKGCIVEMKSYEACMKELEKKKPPKRMRVRANFNYFLSLLVINIYITGKVQEEYRGK